jgi:plastocyanin
MRRTITVSLALLPIILVLGWAAAGVAMAGGGCHANVDPIPSEASVTTVKIDGCTYAPTITRVPVGAEVRFINASGQTHDVTGRKFEWGSGELASGKSYTRAFGTAGLYPFSCSLHPGMAGVVVVGSPVAEVAHPADAPDAADITAVSTTTATPLASADNSPAPYLAAGGLGLVAGIGFGAAVVARQRRPA